MNFAWIPRPIRNHNPATAHDLLVRSLSQPTSILADPQSFAEVSARQLLHAVEHCRVSESDFIKHSSSVTQNVLQVFEAGLADVNFHRFRYCPPLVAKR